MKSGIYKIINIVNNKTYIGSAVNLRRRELAHFNKLKHNKHPNLYLQAAYNKSGAAAFQFIVIDHIVVDKLIQAEQHYIDMFSPEYNMCPVAGNSFGRKHRKETIEKIRANSVMRKDLDITKAALELGHGWNRGLKLNDDWKWKLKKAKESKRIPVIRIDMEGVEYCYLSISNAGLDGFHKGHITECCKQKQNMHKGYRWQYASK